MAEDGIEIPVTVEADSATVTIERLAASILELEAAVKKLGAQGKKAGDDLGAGFAQGLGQKAFAEFSAFLESVPGRLDAAVRASAAWSDQLVELGQRSGFAVKQLQEYSLAAKTSGLNTSQLTRFAQQLTPALLKNRDAFTSIGLTFEQLAGLNPGEQFEKVQKALVGIDDPAKRLQATVEIFGKRLGPQLQPFLDSLEEGRKRAEELGLIISDDAVKAASRFQDELDTLREVQDAVTRSIGGFISEDEDLIEMLKRVIEQVGRTNKFVQELASTFHELPAGVKAATAGLALFGVTIVGALPDIFTFITGLATLASGIKDLGETMVILKARFVALLPFLTTAGLLLFGLAAAVSAVVIGAKLGEWLYENVQLFREFTDWGAKAAQALGEFLGLLPDEAERKKMEQGVAAFASATPEQLAALDEFKKKQAEIAAAATQGGTIAATKEELELRKTVLGLESQLAGITAQRAGAIASANQQLATSVANSKLDFELQKLALDERKAVGDIQQAQYDREIGKATIVRDLTIQIAKAQRDQAARQESLRLVTEEAARTKELVAIEKQIEDARKFGLTALEQIADKQNEAVDAAERTFDARIEQLAAEREIGKLEGQRLEDNLRAVTQAGEVLARQKELAAAVAETAMRQRELNFAREHGLDVTEATARATAEILEQIGRVASNPKALVSPNDLKVMDDLLEKSKRLGVSLQDLGVAAGVSFARFQAEADALAQRLSDQEIGKEIDEIDRKLRQGVRLTQSDLSGLIEMRKSLTAGSTQAEALEKRIRAVGDAVRATGKLQLIEEGAVRLADQLVRKEQEKFERSREYRKEVEKATIALLVAQGVAPEVAQAMVQAQQKTESWNKGLDKALSLFNSLLTVIEGMGVAADSVAGKFLAIGQSALQAAEAGKAAKAAIEAGNTTQAIAAGAGVAGNILKGSKTQDAKQGALQGAAQGAAFGAAFGPQGAAIGAIAGGLIGFFGGSKFRKIAKDAGKVLGEGLSDETISKIEEDSKKLGITIKQASLLNVSTAIEDTGKAASTFGPQVQSLIQGIADKSIPAKEGMEELAKSFTLVADEAIKAERVGDRALVGIIKQARASGVESPEIKAFVSDQLSKAAAGFDKFAALFQKQTKEQIEKLGKEADKAFAGLSDSAVKKLAENTGAVFGAVFGALVSEQGIVGAVDQMKGSFDILNKRLTETLGQEAVNKILGPFGAAFETIGNEKLRPIFEGIDGLSQAMQGLANSGFLTLEQFTAIQQATSTLFDEAIAGGADTKTALLAIAPSIQAAITAAEQFGVPLDEDTERLKRLAEENGIAFKTDPMEKMVDVLTAIAEVLGADIPESVRRTENAINNVGQTGTEQFGQVEESARGFVDTTGEKMRELAGASAEAFSATTIAVTESFDAIALSGTESFATLQTGTDELTLSLAEGIPEAADVAIEALRELQTASAQEINVGGGGAAGGTSGPRSTTANVTVNLGVNENPLASAQTAAQMRQATVGWVADAIEDRIPSIISAVEGNQ